MDNNLVKVFLRKKKKGFVLQDEKCISYKNNFLIKEIMCYENAFTHI